MAPEGGDFNLGSLKVEVNSFGITETVAGLILFSLFLFELLIS